VPDNGSSNADHEVLRSLTAAAVPAPQHHDTPGPPPARKLRLETAENQRGIVVALGYAHELAGEVVYYGIKVGPPLIFTSSRASCL
jgi:hypothetical protein